MHRRQCFDRLEFDDDTILDNQVGSESFFENNIIIFKSNALLTLDVKAPFFERSHQYRLIH